MTNWSPNQLVGRVYNEAIEGRLTGQQVGPVAFYLDSQDIRVLCCHHIPTSMIIRFPLCTIESATHLVALTVHLLDIME